MFEFFFSFDERLFISTTSSPKTKSYEDLDLSKK